MIRRLEGKLVDKLVDSLLVDCGGVGYIVSVTLEDRKIPSLNDKIIVWTHHAIREDSQDLYGFLKKTDLDFFKTLITVSGIGPKTALGLMNAANVDTMREGIISGDPAYLAKLTGIGRKTAEKIVFELSGKIDGLAGIEKTEGASAEHEATADVIDALKALGYMERDVRDIMKKLDKKSSPESQIKEALSLLGKNSKNGSKK